MNHRTKSKQWKLKLYKVGKNRSKFLVRDERGGILLPQEGNGALVVDVQMISPQN